MYKVHERRSGNATMASLIIIFFPFLFVTTALPVMATDIEQLDDPRLSGRKRGTPQNAYTNPIGVSLDTPLIRKNTNALAEKKEKSCQFCQNLSEGDRGVYKKIVRDFVTFKLQNCLPSEKGLLSYIKDSKWWLTINFICESGSLQGHTSSCIADKMGLNTKTFRTYIKHADDGFAPTAKGKEVIERNGVAPLPASVNSNYPVALTHNIPLSTSPLIRQPVIAPCLRTVPMILHANLLTSFLAMMRYQLLITASFSTAIPISPYPNPLMPCLIMPESQSTAPILPAPLAVQPNTLKRKPDETNNSPDNLQSPLNTRPIKTRKLER